MHHYRKSHYRIRSILGQGRGHYFNTRSKYQQSKRYLKAIYSVRSVIDSIVTMFVFEVTRLYHCDKYPRETTKKEAKICFGSQFQRFQSLVSWTHCSQACGEARVSWSQHSPGLSRVTSKRRKQGTSKRCLSQTHSQ